MSGGTRTQRSPGSEAVRSRGIQDLVLGPGGCGWGGASLLEAAVTGVGRGRGCSGNSAVVQCTRRASAMCGCWQESSHALSFHEGFHTGPTARGREQWTGHRTCVCGHERAPQSTPGPLRVRRLESSSGPLGREVGGGPGGPRRSERHLHAASGWWKSERAPGTHTQAGSPGSSPGLPSARPHPRGMAGVARGWKEAGSNGSLGAPPSGCHPNCRPRPGWGHERGEAPARPQGRPASVAMCGRTTARGSWDPRPVDL